MFVKNNNQYNKTFYFVFTITINGMGVLDVGILVSPHQVGTHKEEVVDPHVR